MAFSFELVLLPCRESELRSIPPCEREHRCEDPRHEFRSIFPFVMIGPVLRTGPIILKIEKKQPILAGQFSRPAHYLKKTMKNKVFLQHRGPSEHRAYAGAYAYFATSLTLPLQQICHSEKIAAGQGDRVAVDTVPRFC